MWNAEKEHHIGITEPKKFGWKKCKQWMKWYCSWITENNIEDEGAKAMSEILKVNTTLTSLDLEGEREKGIEKEKKKEKEITV